jgi:hypothetical protein
MHPALEGTSNTKRNNPIYAWWSSPSTHAMELFCVSITIVGAAVVFILIVPNIKYVMWMVMITFGLLVRVMMTGTQPILPELPSQTNTVHKEFVWVLAPALQVWTALTLPILMIRTNVKKVIWNIRMTFAASYAINFSAKMAAILSLA